MGEAGATVAAGGLCVHCRKRAGTKARRLCKPCYERPGVRDRYRPVRDIRPAEAARGPCLHCETRKAADGKRGLCSRCYFDPEVRSLYPSGNPAVSPHDPDFGATTEITWERWRDSHPLWKPCPYPPSDRRYNAAVAEREAAGLPARHPEDLPPDPD